MKRDEILDQAKEIINGARAEDYGSAREGFERTATMWSAITGHEITAEQVPAMLIALKLSRLSVSPNHTDSWLGIVGYAALGGELGDGPSQVNAQLAFMEERRARLEDATPFPQCKAVYEAPRSPVSCGRLLGHPGPHQGSNGHELINWR